MPFCFLCPASHTLFSILMGRWLIPKPTWRRQPIICCERWASPSCLSIKSKVFIGLGARVLIERALGQERTDLVADGFALFMNYYNAHLLDRTKPYPGMEAFLVAARTRGMSLSVLTNKPEQPTQAILSGLGLADYFSVVIGGDTLPKRKPDPGGVFVLHKTVDCPLTDTLLIGDSDIDIRTGRAAGIATCGVTWGFGRAGFETFPPTFLVETVQALHRIAFL